MRIHRPPGHRHRRGEDRAGLGFGDVERPVVRPAIGAVGGHMAVRRVDPQHRLALVAEQPDRAEADMADRQVVVLVDRQAIRPVAAAHLDIGADLGDLAVVEQGDLPDRIGARDGEEQHILRLVEHQAVGAGHIAQQAFEPAAVGAQAVEPARGIGQARLPLVGEVHVAVAGEDQVVGRLEAFERGALQERPDLARRRIEDHDAVLVIADESAAVLVELEAVGLPVVLAADRDLARRRDLQQAAPGDVDDPEVARAVEGGTFQEGRGIRPAELDRGPIGIAAGDPDLVGNLREDIGGDAGRGGEHRLLHSENGPSALMRVIAK